jgi:hypothetical protein
MNSDVRKRRRDGKMRPNCGKEYLFSAYCVLGTMLKSNVRLGFLILSQLIFTSLGYKLLLTLLHR